jgi:Rhodopirellula transposase DDE domain
MLTRTAQLTLVEHLAGTQWEIVQSPNAGTPGKTSSQLRGILAASANNLWAVGESIDIANDQGYTLAMRWNGVKWVIVAVLQQIDIPVSATIVSRLLYQMDFSLRVSRKQIATNSSPYRDQQFQRISALRARFQRQGLPIISVDS